MLQRQSFAVLRHLRRDLRLSRSISGSSGLWGKRERYPQTQPIGSLGAVRPHFTSTSIYKQPIPLFPCLRFHRYLSTSSEEGSEEGLKWYDIDTSEFAKIVASYQAGTTTVSLIDVRQPEELAESGKVPGTINIPLGDVEEALRLDADIFQERYGVPKPTQDSDVIFHCRAGVRSLVAIDTANKLGYSRARHYVRGYLGWQDHIGEK